MEPHKADVFFHRGVMFEAQRCRSYRPDAVVATASGHVLGYAYWGMGIPRQHSRLSGLVIVIKKLSLFVAVASVLEQSYIIGRATDDLYGFFRWLRSDRVSYVTCEMCGAVC